MPSSLPRPLALLLCAFALASCGVPPRTRPLQVVATVLPLADWARQVGGERVDVRLIVPPSINPRTYEPSAEQQKAIRAADVVLLHGLGLDPWVEETLDQVRERPIVVLDVSQFTRLPAVRAPARGTSSGEAGEPPGGRRRGRQATLVPTPVYSAYLWLDPRSAISQVTLIAQTLTRADPAGLPIYRQNAARYSGELENLDSSIERQVKSWKSKSLVVADQFLFPFAQRYDLTVALIDDPLLARSVPYARPVLVDGLRSDVGTWKDAGGGRPVTILNPLAGRTYIELMQTNAQTMTAVMSRS